MRFLRPSVSRTIARHLPARRSPPPSPQAVKWSWANRTMQGLGDLGDELSAASAVPGFVSKLKSFVISRAGTTMSGAVANNLSLPAIIYSASDIYAKGNAGQLIIEAQAAWASFRAQAEPATSPTNIYWVLARCINRWSSQLITAANEQISSGLLGDAAASKCSYTLMDTTQQGTTWIGGTITASKLDNPQWGAVFEVAFNTIAKGIIAGVLPFTYLDVLLTAMCTDTVKRRFPVWSPPFTGLVANDPRAAAFRATMKQLGWNSVTKLWFGYTQQAWVEQNDIADQQDAALNGAVVALNYVSGKAIYDQIVSKVQEYFQARAQAVDAIKQFDKMQSGPIGSYVPAADISAITALKQQFASADTSVNKVLEPAGLWPSNTPAGLSFLGVAQYVVGGIIAIGILGMVVWAISIMTATTRSAAAQTKATADRILATVNEVTASCMRTYEASAKTPADEKAYQDCLLRTKALTDSIPKPPDGGDPLGMKWVALLGLVGVGGLFVWAKFGKKG